MKTTDKAGLGDNLFCRLALRRRGQPKPDFVLNRPEAQGAQVLLAGDNFGCGSSREHAPWALAGFGFRAVISTSFADIFRNNALKNGLLPVVVDARGAPPAARAGAADPAAEVTVDLAEPDLTPAGRHDRRLPD